MPEQMVIYRLEDLSMIYFVKDVYAPFAQVTIVDEFPKQILTVPTISVVNGKLSEEEFEMGNRDTGVRLRRWFIDIFAVNKSQRDDFGYKILQQTKNGINVYDYNEGFPPSASPTKINHLSVISKTYEPLDVIPSLNEKLYYRGQIILITKNDKV